MKVIPPVLQLENYLKEALFLGVRPSVSPSVRPSVRHAFVTNNGLHFSYLSYDWYDHRSVRQSRWKKVRFQNKAVYTA